MGAGPSAIQEGIRDVCAVRPWAEASGSARCRDSLVVLLAIDLAVPVRPLG